MSSRYHSVILRWVVGSELWSGFGVVRHAWNWVVKILHI
jgi:hypothetical protein